MRQQDYEAIAALLRARIEREGNAQHQGAGTRAAVHTTQAIARDLAEYFRRDNARFQRGQFFRACGIAENDEALRAVGVEPVTGKCEPQQ